MIKETNIILRGKNKKGDSLIMYPATTKGNITDLENATEKQSGLMSGSDKAKLDKVTYTFGSDENGFYIETL